MSRIKDKFNELQNLNEGALIPYITLGDPTLERSLEIAKTLIAAGADILELGIHMR